MFCSQFNLPGPGGAESSDRRLQSPCQPSGPRRTVLGAQQQPVGGQRCGRGRKEEGRIRSLAAFPATPPPVGRRRPSALWQWEAWRDLNTTRPQGCLEENNMRSPPTGLFWSPALWRKLNTTLTTGGRSEKDLDLEFYSTLEAKKQKICCFLYRLQTHRLTCKFLFLNVWEFCFGFLFYC